MHEGNSCIKACSDLARSCWQAWATLALESSIARIANEDMVNNSEILISSQMKKLVGLQRLSFYAKFNSVITNLHK